MKYLEGTKYKLQANYYESIILNCTYVEDNTIWFISQPSDYLSTPDNYKLNTKTNKLYKYSTKFRSWDCVENSLSEYTADDVWSKRTGNQTYSYDGMNQGD